MSASDLLEVPAIPADFGFSDEHELARAEARRFLSERSPMTEVRRLVTDEPGFDQTVFSEIAKLGWIGLTMPAELGGLGLDTLHLAPLVEEMGRVPLPFPYFGSLLAACAIERGGSDAQKRALVPAIIRGERIAPVALSEPDGSFDLGEPAARAEPDGGGVTIRGVKTHVLFGSRASLCVVPCREPSDRVGLYVVDLPSRHATIEVEKPL